MNINLRGGFKFLNVLSKVSTHSESQTCVYLIQRSNYGKIVRESNPDVFGTLSPKNIKAPEVSFESNEWEEDDIIEEKIPENLAIKLIRKSVAALDYDGAMEHYRNFVAHSRPNPFMYRLLFACGAKLGKAKETFSLYQDLRKRAIKIHPSMYTSLLYACANCEDSELALKIGKKIHTHITQRNVGPNEIHINALLLTLARHGDMKSAFNFVDYLNDGKFEMNVTIFNHMMENCCSNKEYGLRIAVSLYHNLLLRKLLPNIYTFSILARCIEKCGFGNSLSTQNFFKFIFERNRSETKSVNEVRQSDLSLPSSNVNEKLESGNNSLDETVGENDFDVGNEEVKKGKKRGDTITGTFVEEEKTGKDSICGITLDSVNILKPKALDVSYINCNKLRTPENRLMMFGGLKGFLEVMSDYGIKPNLKVFSQLLRSLPQTDEAEEELMQALKSFEIKPDCYFYNLLLNRMISRNKFEKFEEYLEFTKGALMKIDIFTIGSLARLCNTKEKAVKCIEFARSHKIRISVNILEIILKNGRSDPELVSYMLEVADEDQVEFNTEMFPFLNRKHLLRILNKGRGRVGKKRKDLRDSIEI